MKLVEDTFYTLSLLLEIIIHRLFQWISNAVPCPCLEKTRAKKATVFLPLEDLVLSQSLLQAFSPLLSSDDGSILSNFPNNNRPTSFDLSTPLLTEGLTTSVTVSWNGRAGSSVSGSLSMVTPNVAHIPQVTTVEIFVQPEPRASVPEVRQPLPASSVPQLCLPQPTASVPQVHLPEPNIS